ncbi:hypothetical protein Q1695_006754 [Nippostrongylus brasiliensis]|nr:hypothetical protein Q1695_006754 [Nippostrongylus brasiliensis]
MDKKQIRTIFLFQFKLGRSAAEAARDINVALGSRTTNERTVQRWVDKWVPHDSNDVQRNRCLETSPAHLLRNRTEPILDRIVTRGEKWILYDNRKRLAQWLDVDEAPKHYPKPKAHQKKATVTVWWSAAGFIHRSFLKPCEKMTSEYCQELGEIHSKLPGMCPRLVNTKGPIILYDNARLHVSMMARQKLHELGYEVLDHSPYSADLSPTNYHLFKHLKIFLRHKIKRIEKLACRWQKCVDSNSFYFD